MKLAAAVLSVFLAHSYHHEVIASSNSGRHLWNKERKNANLLTTNPLSSWDSRRRVEDYEYYYASPVCVPPSIDNGIEKLQSDFSEDNCEDPGLGLLYTCSFELSSLDEMERVCNNASGKLYYYSASVVCEDAPGAITTTRLSVQPTCLSSCSAEDLATRWDYEYSAVTKEGCVFDTVDKIFVDGKEFSLIDMKFAENTKMNKSPKANKAPKATKTSKMSKARTDIRL